MIIDGLKISQNDFIKQEKELFKIVLEECWQDFQYDFRVFDSDIHLGNENFHNAYKHFEKYAKEIIEDSFYYLEQYKNNSLSVPSPYYEVIKTLVKIKEYE